MANIPVGLDDVRRRLCELRNVLSTEYEKGLMNMALSALEGMKPLDVAPVVHGKWETQGRDATCSVCKYIQIGAYRAMWYSPYCPNCGAKMNAKEAEDSGQENN